jgi:hypothetical protein
LVYNMSYFGSGQIKSTLNTSTTPLSSGATYTGTAELNNRTQVTVSCQTDVDGTLYFDFSNDGTNWSTFPVAGFSVAAGIHEYHTARKDGRYFRVRLVNGSGNQTYLRLYTYFGQTGLPNAPLNQSLGLDTDAIMTRPSSFQDEVVIGRRSGVTPWNKFAYRDNLTSAGGEQTIWATTGNYVIPTSAETYTITYGGSDGAATTGALVLTFYHIDSSGNPEIQTHTLGTGGSDVTSFSGLGINRCVVSSSGSANYNNGAITITHTTSGNTVCIIPAQGSVTQQAIFHVGANHSAIAKFLTFNVNKLSGSNPKVTVKGYVFNRGISTTFEIYRHIIDTQSETTVTIEDPIGFKLNATDVLYFVADTDQNNTVVTFRFSLNEYSNS